MFQNVAAVTAIKTFSELQLILIHDGAKGASRVLTFKLIISIL